MIMNTPNPIRKPDVLAQDMGGETVLYNGEEKALHILNAAAQRIWELCDGEHSVEDLSQAMRANFSVPEECDVARDIQQTLEIFYSKSLLEQQQ